MDVALILEKHKIPLIIGLIGLVLIIGGGFLIAISRQSEDKIEIIPAGSETTAVNQKIKADIEGAVIKPGVYELETGSRVNDLLIIAGGLSAEADREWVQTTLNLAQKITDGAKIFIPKVSKDPASAKASAGEGSGIIAGQQTATLININTASAAQLDTLYGVGPATAQKIIDGRPYLVVEDLVTKKAVGKSVFEKIKGLITVF